MDQPTKHCPRCKEDRPLDQYGKRAASPDGLTSACRQCVNKAAAEAREGNREQLAAAERERRKRPDVKAKAKERLQDPVYKEDARLRTANWREDNRERDRQNARDYAAEHREEAKQRAAQWKKDNPERFTEQQADWYRRNREKKAKYQANRRVVLAAELVEYRRRRRAEHGDLIRQRERLAKQIRKARKLAVQQLPYTMAQVEAKFGYWGNRCWVCGTTGKLALDHVKPLARGGADMLCNFRPICTPCNSAKGAKWPLPSREIIGNGARLLDANRLVR